MKNIFDLFKKNKGIAKCPYCGSHNTSPAVIHSYDSEHTFDSYDMLCNNCGHTFVIKDR